MKHITLTLIILLAAFSAGGEQLWCFNIDDGTLQTNIRETPGGKVVLSFAPSVPYFILITGHAEKGWWRVLDIEEAVEESVEGEPISLSGSKKGTYWIHNSMIALGTRNYGENNPYPLRATPSKKGKVTYTLPGECYVHPIDIKGDWVKVKTDNGKQGWIETEMLCDNPLTTCP